MVKGRQGERVVSTWNYPRIQELMGWMDQVEAHPVREHLLVQIEGVNTKDERYCGKTMACIYEAKRKTKGNAVPMHLGRDLQEVFYAILLDKLLMLQLHILFLMSIMINYDDDEDVKRNKVSEDKWDGSLGVREFDGSPKIRWEYCWNRPRTNRELAEGFSEVRRKFAELAKKDRSLPKKLDGTCQDHCEVREFAESSRNGFRGFVGSSPKARRKKSCLADFIIA
ncbi:hypothetical protein MUK42_10963 [Musa troglodytarum]|uniref:Uncharacterized protein n=1 Tax=Musa troglodytarum TaxID=320322 RepID=A0A9E7G8Y5_9LILI|nr:hypothetical protein MUK42_10963 [Musa troglodytarum]